MTRGKKHTYAGLDIDFIGDGKEHILMLDYLTKEVINNFGEDVSLLKSNIHLCPLLLVTSLLLDLHALPRCRHTIGSGRGHTIEFEFYLDGGGDKEATE